MLEPPGLRTPYANDSERGAALAELLGACMAIEQWLRVAAERKLTPDRSATLSKSLQPGDTPELKLERWSALFDEELRAVIDARNRAIHGVRLGDAELRGAVWLARHLLRLLDPAQAA